MGGRWTFVGYLESIISLLYLAQTFVGEREGRLAGGWCQTVSDRLLLRWGRIWYIVRVCLENGNLQAANWFFLWEIYGT